MSQLVTFRGWPVKRRYLTAAGLRLILFHPVRRRRGIFLHVSQQEWQEFGAIQYFTHAEKPDPRQIARQLGQVPSSGEKK